jgi:hypothetical protein
MLKNNAMEILYLSEYCILGKNLVRSLEVCQDIPA